MSEREIRDLERPLHPVAAAMVRAAVGALAGAVVGSLIAVLVFVFPARESTFPKLTISLIGAIGFAAIAVVAGARRLPDFVKYAAIGVLIGIFIGGGCVGHFVYPAVREALAGHRRPKSGDHVNGFLVGTPVGAALGVAGGLCAYALRPRGRLDSPEARTRRDDP
jgi:hypothetical protein